MDSQIDPSAEGLDRAGTRPSSNEPQEVRGWERANNRRRTPIVALTGSALEEAIHRTRVAGCDAHATKPVKKSTLLDAIRDAIERTPLEIERADVDNFKEELCRTE